MKIISEYIFSGLFMLATVTAWIYGEIGAGLIILSLGIYFPHRALINDLLNIVNSWDLPPNMKFMWGAVSMLIIIEPFMLLFFNVVSYAIGLLMICLLTYFDLNASKS